jgi:hypothetical protein
MDRFMGKNGHKKAQRLIDHPLRPEPAPAPAPVEESQKLFPGQPVERETPSESKYLAPSEGGPRRLIIMLSDDGTIIEPLGVFGGLTILQQTSLVAQMNGILVENLIAGVKIREEYTARLEQKVETLVTNIDFLHEQIAKGISPPARGVTPDPFPVVREIVTDD